MEDKCPYLSRTIKDSHDKETQNMLHRIVAYKYGEKFWNLSQRIINWPPLNRVATFKVDERTASYIINTTYVIILGVIFKSMLHISLNHGASGKEFFQMQLTLSTENALFFLLLTVYFLFDWFSINVTTEAISTVRQGVSSTAGDAPEGGINHFSLLAIVIFAILLGFITISSINQMPKKFFYFGLYGVIAPFWDLFPAMGRFLRELRDAHRFIYYTVFVYTRTTLAFVVGIVALFQLIRGGQFEDQLYIVVIICCFVYFAIKLLRYFFFVSLVTTRGR